VKTAPPHPSAGPASGARAGDVVFAVLALVFLGAGLAADPRAWGLNALAFLPRAAWAAAAAALVLVALPGMARRAEDAAAAVGAGVLPSLRRVLIVAGAAGVGFFAGRLQVQLLGDGIVWVQKLEAHTAFQHFEPLAALVTSRVARVLDAAAPAKAAGAPSVILGVLYVVATAFLCRALWSGAAARGLAWLLLLAHPALLLFFGYVESYPLLLVVQVLFALALARAARAGFAAALLPALLLAVAMASHLQAILWLPALVALVRVQPANAGRSLRRPIAFAVATLAAGFLLALAAGARPGDITAALGSDAALGAVTPRWFFSLRHAIDLANEYGLLVGAPLVLAAAALAGGVRLRALRGATWTPILWMLPGPLLFSLLVPPHIGAARDWDLYVSLALPALLLGVEAWRRATGGAGGDPAAPAGAVAGRGVAGRGVAGRALGLAVVTTAAWLAVNVDAPRAARRLVVAQDPRGTFDNFARGYTNETLGVYYRTFDAVAARDAYARAAAANPKNARYYNNLGNAEVQLGHIAAGRDAYRRALELGMHEWHVVYNLGICELQLDRPEEAQEVFDQLMRDWPQQWQGPAMRARARLDMDRAEEALADLERAAVLAPRQPEVHYSKGLALRAMGRQAEARAALKEALRFDADYGPARRALERLEAESSKQQREPEPPPAPEP